MFLDFHYYATYCAAYLAGYSHEESLDVAYSAAFVDNCTITLLNKLNAPKAAATTQYIAEMADDTIKLSELQKILKAKGEEINLQIKVQHMDIFNAMHEI